MPHDLECRREKQLARAAAGASNRVAEPLIELVPEQCPDNAPDRPENGHAERGAERFADPLHSVHSDAM
jgi:hypothetical protein